jgi:hypothetical protein
VTEILKGKFKVLKAKNCTTGGISKSYKEGKEL